MVRRTYLGFIAALLFCFAASAVYAQPMADQSTQSSPSEPHDGHWWSKKSFVYKEGFMSGYHAGLVKQSGGKPTDLKGLGSSQLIEGLEKFYKDFRNQKIVVDDALTYVIQEIQGVPDDKLAANLLKMRQAAAGRGDE